LGWQSLPDTSSENIKWTRMNGAYCFYKRLHGYTTQKAIPWRSHQEWKRAKQTKPFSQLYWKPHLKCETSLRTTVPPGKHEHAQYLKAVDMFSVLPFVLLIDIVQDASRGLFHHSISCTLGSVHLSTDEPRDSWSHNQLRGSQYRGSYLRTCGVLHPENALNYNKMYTGRWPVWLFVRSLLSMLWDHIWRFLEGTSSSIPSRVLGEQGLSSSVRSIPQ